MNSQSSNKLISWFASIVGIGICLFAWYRIHYMNDPFTGILAIIISTPFLVVGWLWRIEEKESKPEDRITLYSSDTGFNMKNMLIFLGCMALFLFTVAFIPIFITALMLGGA